MIMDNLLLLDGSVSAAGVFSGTAVNSGTTFVSGGGGTTSFNILDVSQLASSASGYGRDIGIGDDLELVVMVTTLFTGASSTLQVQLQYAPDSSGSPGTFVTVAQSIAYPLTALLAGAELLRIKLPPMTPSPATGSALPKFIQMNYVIGVANMTAGAIAAFIVIDKTALGPLLGYRSGYSNAYL
jgi:hypothetical protein